MRALAIVALVAACDGFDTPQLPTRGEPHANAGTGSLYPMGTTITLDGSLSFDPDGTIREYRWTVRERPPRSNALPVDEASATTSFTLDDAGEYLFELEVTDDNGQSDASELRVIALGVITNVDAGPTTSVSWLESARLVGAVTTLHGEEPTYQWRFVSRPAGSTAELDGAKTSRPAFLVDATGTYVLALEARVGEEVREDTVVVESSATGLALGSTGAVAWTYSQLANRIVFVRGTTSAEVVRLDPMTGARTSIVLDTFTPKSIAIDDRHQSIALGGLGRVARVLVDPNLSVLARRPAPGCTAAHVTMPWVTRIDCWPVDGDAEPISSVNLDNGVVTQIDCPVKKPYARTNRMGDTFLVDGASSQFFVYENGLNLVSSGTLTGHTPPVIPFGQNEMDAVTGNGLAVIPPTTLKFNLMTRVLAGAYSNLRFELAIASETHLKIHHVAGGQLLSAVLPTVNGMPPTVKLVAYDRDQVRLYIVVGTPSGEVIYTVAR